MQRQLQVLYLVVKRQRTLEGNVFCSHTGHHTKCFWPDARSWSLCVQLQLFYSLHDNEQAMMTPNLPSSSVTKFVA